MKASSHRDIKPGKEYDKYFKPAKMDVINLPEGNVFDTLDRIQNLVSNTLNQTEEISSVLTNTNLKKTLSNVWNFLYNHIQYKEDTPGIEQLRTPSRSWADRTEGIDCDCYSVFISSILTNLKIQHSLRIAEYGSKGYYQHVYVVVPIDGANIKGRSSYVVIDPVVNNFNYEVKFSKIHDKKMNIAHQVLNGTGFLEPSTSFGSEFDVLDGLGSVSNSIALDAMRNHLSNTLKELSKNKEQISPIVNADVFKEQVEYVLENWNDPVARMGALEEMEEMEELEEDLPDSEGLEGFFRSNKALTKVRLLKARRRSQKRIVPALIRRNTLPANIIKHSKVRSNLIATNSNNISNTIEKSIIPNKQNLNCSCTSVNGLGRRRKKRRFKKFFGKMKDAVKTVAKKVGKGLKKVVKTVGKYNPLSLAMRGGMLLALKLNLMKVTERLKYGYLTQQQAQSKGIDLNEWRKTVFAKDRAEDFYRKLGGDASRFRQGVLNGKNGGLGEPVTMASATAAVSALLAKIGGFLKNINFDKLKNSKIGTFISKNKGAITAIKKMMPAANERQAPGLPPNISVPSNQTPYMPSDFSKNAVPEKNNTPLYIGLGIGVTAIGGLLYYKSQQNKPAKAVAGTPKKKVKHAKL